MDADYVVVCFDGVYDERLVPLFREIYVMFEVFRLFFIADSAFESVGGRADDGSVAGVVRVNIARRFNRDGIVTATAPRVTAQDTFDGQPQTF